MEGLITAAAELRWSLARLALPANWTGVPVPSPPNWYAPLREGAEEKKEKEKRNAHALGLGTAEALNQSQSN